MTDYRADVYWNGKLVGTLPADFDPLGIKSASFFYDARSGDFTREGEVWIATHRLGPGDLEAVPGFQWRNADDQCPPSATEAAFSAIGFALMKDARQ